MYRFEHVCATSEASARRFFFNFEDHPAKLRAATLPGIHGKKKTTPGRPGRPTLKGSTKLGTPAKGELEPEVPSGKATCAWRTQSETPPCLGHPLLRIYSDSCDPIPSLPTSLKHWPLHIYARSVSLFRGTGTLKKVIWACLKIGGSN